jgi:hypothetical protein
VGVFTVLLHGRGLLRQLSGVSNASPLRFIVMGLKIDDPVERLQGGSV